MRYWWRKSRAKLLGVLLASPLLFYLIGLLFFLSPSGTLSLIQSVTEIISLRVVSADASRFAAAGAWLQGESANDPAGECVRAFVVPATGTKLTIVRINSGPLFVTLDASNNGQASRLLFEDGSSRALKGRTRLTFDPKNARCKGAAAIRIPLSGVVVLGDEVAAPSLLDEQAPILLSGEAKLYGRGISDNLGLLPFEPTLFPLSNAVSIPKGSRIQECYKKGSKKDGRAAWWGLAEANLTSVDAGFNVSLYTDAPRLALYTPGGSKPMDSAPTCTEDKSGIGSSTDMLSIGLLARIAGDPNLSLITVMLGVYAVLLEILLTIFFAGNERNEQ
jgi:hypothetical protein